MKKIQILGTGCPKCNKLAELANTTATELGIEFTLEKVTDINEILGFGVMMTPALVIDGNVEVTGRVPSIEEIKKFLG